MAHPAEPGIKHMTTSAVNPANIHTKRVHKKHQVSAPTLEYLFGFQSFWGFRVDMRQVMNLSGITSELIFIPGLKYYFATNSESRARGFTVLF